MQDFFVLTCRTCGNETSVAIVAQTVWSYSRPPAPNTGSDIQHPVSAAEFAELQQKVLESAAEFAELKKMVLDSTAEFAEMKKMVLDSTAEFAESKKMVLGTAKRLERHSRKIAFLNAWMQETAEVEAAEEAENGEEKAEEAVAEDGEEEKTEEAVAEDGKEEEAEEAVAEEAVVKDGEGLL